MSKKVIKYITKYTFLMSLYASIQSESFRYGVYTPTCRCALFFLSPSVSALSHPFFLIVLIVLLCLFEVVPLAPHPTHTLDHVVLNIRK